VSLLLMAGSVPFCTVWLRLFAHRVGNRVVLCIVYVSGFVLIKYSCAPFMFRPCNAGVGDGFSL